MASMGGNFVPGGNVFSSRTSRSYASVGGVPSGWPVGESGRGKIGP